MKKTLALLIGASLLAGMTGCSLFKKGPITEDKFISVLEKKLQAEEVDTDDFIDALSDEDDLDLFEDGVYCTADDDDMRDVGDELDLEMYFGSLHHVKSSVDYLYTDGDNEAVYIAFITFKDEDDVEDFMEETAEIWEEQSSTIDNFEMDDSTDGQLLGYSAMNHVDLYLGAYAERESVIIIIDSNDEDRLEEICNAFGLVSPETVG